LQQVFHDNVTSLYACKNDMKSWKQFTNYPC
jgi:hypothetical protein